MAKQGNLVREGAIVGLLGASAVALWFLLVDTITGDPLQTPMALGGALFGAGASGGGWATLLGYTAFHFGAFFGVGVLAAYSTRLAEQRPHVLALFLVLFFMFQAGFHGLAAILDVSAFFGEPMWLQVAVGNLLATAAMGGYLWKQHPVIHRNLEIALEG